MNEKTNSSAHLCQGREAFGQGFLVLYSISRFVLAMTHGHQEEALVFTIINQQKVPCSGSEP